MTYDDIIIVGGGLAGLGCAKRLHENGKKFKMITENIGGRVKTSPDGETNYGAYYITADCHNILPYIEKVNLMHFAKAHLHRGNDHYHLYSPRIIKYIPAGLRIIIDLIRFRYHFQKLRKQSLYYSRQELIEADPLLQKYYHQRAKVYIKERGLESLTKEYLEQFLWASFFYDPREVSTAIFLGSLLPIIVPSYSFKLHFEQLIKNFQDRILFDSIVKVARLSNGDFQLIAKSGKIFQCTILVLATPMNITNTLIKPQKIKGDIEVNYYHLRGEIKKEYNLTWYNFFSLEEEGAISRELNGTYLYFYGRKDNIGKYFNRWEIITKDFWKPALFFLGDEYINENPEPNLFLANDHNVAGIEDAFISGIYAASRILKFLNS